MIRVANIISDTNIGGAGRLLLSFLKNCDREKFGHEVVLPQNSLLAGRITELGIPVVFADGIADKSLDWGAVSGLRGLFKQKKYDVVHSHAVMSARIAAKGIPGTAVVSTRHSVFDQPERDKRFPRRQLNGFMNNFFGDLIIAVSPAAKENIVEIGANPEKVRVIMNGVPETRRLTEEEKLAVREEYGLLPDDFVVAVIARLARVKGHEYVLDAARILKNVDPKIKFLIAGTGELEGELRQKAESLELPNVVFTGFVDQIERVENIMDLQVNASYGTEATSLSLLEGMSLGIPAVVSDFGGNPYVIETGQNGVVIPKKNPAELAAKILFLKQDPDYYGRLQNGALTRYREKFTDLEMTRQIENEYKRLYQMKGGARGRVKS